MNGDLIRVEYKLDLIIRALQDKGLMLSSLPSLRGIKEDPCPLCGIPITLAPNLHRETLHYSCGCSLPLTIVPGISALTTKMIKEKEDASSRSTDNTEVLIEAPDGRSDRRR